MVDILIGLKLSPKSLWAASYHNIDYVHYWFKSYDNLPGWVDFASWITVKLKDNYAIQMIYVFWSYMEKLIEIIINILIYNQIVVHPPPLRKFLKGSLHLNIFIKEFNAIM